MARGTHVAQLKIRAWDHAALRSAQRPPVPTTLAECNETCQRYSVQVRLTESRTHWGSINR